MNAVFVKISNIVFAFYVPILAFVQKRIAGIIGLKEIVMTSKMNISLKNK